MGRGRTYLLSVEYLPALRDATASISVYYTDPLPEALNAPALILPDGRFVTAGGHRQMDTMGNYNPSASVYAFSPFTVAAEAVGFASESAFYRNFKALTGQTPAEWLAQSPKL